MDLSNDGIIATYGFVGFLYFWNFIGLVFLFLLAATVLGIAFWKIKQIDKEYYKNGEKVELIKMIQEIEKERLYD